MTVVPKTVLADVISTMPDDVFDAARDEDMDAEDVEEMDESQAGNLIDSEVVGAFVHLCDNSLVHTELASEEMQDIIDELGFNALFELGSEIMEMSIENTGEIRDFRKQS